jgi:hypothetical protein
MHSYLLPPLQSRPGQGKQATPNKGHLLDAEATRKLAEVGFLAATTGNSRLAKVIFTALRMDQPGSVAAELGMAVGEAMSGDNSEALHILDRLVCECPKEAAIVHAWRGLVYHLAGHNAQSRRVLGEIAGASGPGGALARQLLDMIPSRI